MNVLLPTRRPNRATLEPCLTLVVVVKLLRTVRNCKPSWTLWWRV